MTLSEAAAQAVAYHIYEGYASNRETHHGCIIGLDNTKSLRLAKMKADELAAQARPGHSVEVVHFLPCGEVVTDYKPDGFVSPY